jgi:hypothetical protein
MACIGEDELDLRYSVIQPEIGFRHFTAGVSKLKMTSGREHCDMQRYVVAPLAGGGPPAFVRCVRALVDFFYVSQQDFLDEDDITTLQDLITEFHDGKDIILEKGN